MRDSYSLSAAPSQRELSVHRGERGGKYRISPLLKHRIPADSNVVSRQNFFCRSKEDCGRMHWEEGMSRENGAGISHDRKQHWPGDGGRCPQVCPVWLSMLLA